jgi:hypothetical protein
MNSQVFLNLFRCAIDRVEAGFYDRNEWKIASYDTTYIDKESIICYGERTYCYELYHHLRMLMDSYYSVHNIRNPQVRLQAELHKRIIPKLDAEQAGVQPLSGNYYPDFLLHAPDRGDFSKQSVVVEVKANPSISSRDICKDLKKLEEFINSYHYEQGIFLAINVNLERIKQLSQTIIAEFSSDDRHFKSAQKIIIMAKNSENSPLEEICLGDLMAITDNFK